MLFKMLDRQGWKESGHNPVKMLKELPLEVLESATHDPNFLRHYDIVISRFQIGSGYTHPMGQGNERIHQEQRTKVLHPSDG